MIGVGPQARLSKIAEFHVQGSGPAGVTSGFCLECDHVWPCATYRWATDPSIDIICCWDLSDCEEPDGTHEHGRVDQ